MTDRLKPILLSQFEAALCMLDDCIRKCPPGHWDGPAPTHTIAKYPFWLVAYHTLCFVDCYLAPSNEAWQPHPDLHPAGRAELEEEYPSRVFSQDELIRYADICRGKLRAVLGEGPAAETAETLTHPSGFSWLPFSRAELHLYNIRHIQHHTGQLGAYLRRLGVELRWVKTGWTGGPGPV
jgi:hypothetical protein